MDYFGWSKIIFYQAKELPGPKIVCREMNFIVYTSIEGSKAVRDPTLMCWNNSGPRLSKSIQIKLHQRIRSRSIKSMAAVTSISILIPYSSNSLIIKVLRIGALSKASKGYESKEMSFVSCTKTK